MADTYTGFLNLTKPEIGASRDAWGQKLNANADTLDNWAKATDALAKAAVSTTVATVQTLASPLAVVNYLDVVRGNVLRARLAVTAAGLITLGNGDATDDYLRVGQNGTVWTKEIGDLNARIEARASAFATDRAASALASANAYTDNRLETQRTTDYTRTGNLIIGKANPALVFVYPGVISSRLSVGSDAVLHYSNDAGGDLFTVSAGGVITTAELGNLNDRIETRARAYAVDSATSMGNARVTSVALQGSWVQGTGAGQTSAPHPGVMTGIGIATNGIVTNISGRYLYFFTPNTGWVGAASI